MESVVKSRGNIKLKKRELNRGCKLAFLVFGERSSLHSAIFFRFCLKYNLSAL